jgi:hypothetical protein
MKYPKLRIILCLLLVVLWVRSYYRVDVIKVHQQSISSLKGKVGINEDLLVGSGRMAKADVRIYFNSQLVITSLDADAVNSRHSGSVIHYAYLLHASLIGMAVLGTVFGLIARAAKFLIPTH